MKVTFASFMISAFLLASAASAEIATPGTFVGEYELVSEEGRSFKQPEPYCPRKLKVTHRTPETADFNYGLYFEDADGDGVDAGYYFDQELLDLKERAWWQVEEKAVFEDARFTARFRLRRGRQSYLSVFEAERTAEGLLFRHRLRGPGFPYYLTGKYFSYRAKCDYRKIK